MSVNIPNTEVISATRELSCKKFICRKSKIQW